MNPGGTPMPKALVAVSVLALLSLVQPLAGAACVDPPIPVGHARGGYFACADTLPLSALAYQITDPLGTDTGSLDIVCEGSLPATCTLRDDISGNGQAWIESDWTLAQVEGCPIASTGP